MMPHGMAGMLGSMQDSAIATVLRQSLDRERPPARMTAAQAADFLGFEKEDLALLAKEKILRPLGRPVANAVKYYAAVDVLEFSQDRRRLERATELLYQRNRSKSDAQRAREQGDEQAWDAVTEGSPGSDHESDHESIARKPSEGGGRFLKTQ